MASLASGVSIEPSQKVIATGGNERATSDSRILMGRAAEVVGVLLFVYVLWRIFFGVSESFDGIGAATGIAGIAAAWLGRRTLRTALDVPIAAYVALMVLSTILNAGRFPTLDTVTLWQPTRQMAILLLFFYGASFLLRTPMRIALLIVAVVVAISVIGVETAYDHVALNVPWRRMAYYPSVGQWSGYPQLGMLFALALPLPLAAVITSRRGRVIAASSVMAAALLIYLVTVNSRVTYVAAIATYLALGALEIVEFRRFRLLGFALAATLLVGGYIQLARQGGSLAYWWKTRLYLQYITASGPEPAQTGFGRFRVWDNAEAIIRDHPLIGVGPGKYFEAMKIKFPDTFKGEDIHAHNTFLHVAAETGIPAALVLLAIWGILLKSLVQAVRRPDNAHLALGLAGALLAFFVCSLTDHFTAYGLSPRNRIGFLIWTLTAAATVLIGVPKSKNGPVGA